MVPFNNPIPDSQPKPRSSGMIKAWVEAEKLMQIAILLPSSVGVGWLFGALADRWLHQAWIGIAGMVFGGVSGLVYVVRLAITTEGESRTGKNTGAGIPGAKL
jgi:F0F1-type ATP synthase assembly protein I